MKRALRPAALAASLLALALPALAADGVAKSDNGGTARRLADFTESLPLDGFLDARFGVRTRNDPVERDVSLGEARLQLETEQDVGDATLTLVSDFLFDPVADDYQPDFRSGTGFIDLRQANVLLSPIDSVDLKLGRQILTWGTGDLLFINDLFSKDWNSFLIGRDQEYLKAPTDAAKASWFSDALNVNLVYVPRFAPDRFIDGTRVSFYDPAAGTLVGRNDPLSADKPGRWFHDSEVHLRAYRSLGLYELAAYYYDGFWKSPAGMDSNTGQATFPHLQVTGASIRGPLARGIANFELGHYRSSGGAASDPLRRNSEYRFLAGYEQDIANETTLGLQGYLERRTDYGAYRRSLPEGAVRNDKQRWVTTVRLTRLLLRQDLRLSLFNFHSPTDNDGYLRLLAQYKLYDGVRIEAGANLFYGKRRDTFYGQFRNNSNIYTGIRHDF
jgi:hypothetical protein